MSVDRLSAGLRYNPRVIALDRDNLGAPPSTDTPIPNFAPYKAKHVDAARINGGRRVHDRLLPLLSRIEQRTGVPTSIMIAIFGRLLLYVRGLSPSTFLSGTNETCPSIVTESPQNSSKLRGA